MRARVLSARCRSSMWRPALKSSSTPGRSQSGCRTNEGSVMSEIKQPIGKASKRFSAEERAAMRARAKELKAALDGESALRESLAAMAPPDRKLGERLHAIVTGAAPELVPRTWYGMPAYANKDGKVVCYFRNASKFKERYATFGFNDSARLDDGSMWPVVYALPKLTVADEKKIAALVREAVR